MTTMNAIKEKLEKNPMPEHNGPIEEVEDRKNSGEKKKFKEDEEMGRRKEEKRELRGK